MVFILMRLTEITPVVGLKHQFFFNAFQSNIKGLGNILKCRNVGIALWHEMFDKLRSIDSTYLSVDVNAIVCNGTCVYLLPPLLLGKKVMYSIKI